MKFEQAKIKEQDDSNMISLINIVFLILIFFLIASIIRPFTARDIVLAKSGSEDHFKRLTHTLIIDKHGGLTLNGEKRVIEDFDGTLLEAPTGETMSGKTLNVIADQDLEAGTLLTLLNKLQPYKFETIKLVTEKAE